MEAGRPDPLRARTGREIWHQPHDGSPGHHRPGQRGPVLPRAGERHLCQPAQSDAATDAPHRFTEDMSARGQKPSTRVLSARMRPADEETAERLRIRPQEPVLCLQRLRLADGEPLAIELSQLYFPNCERLLEEDLEHNSLYRLLETQYGLPLMEAEQELEAGLAGNEEAQLLKIPIGSAVLFIRRTTYTDRNQPIEYAKSVYRGNKYTFYTHMKREQLMP